MRLEEFIDRTGVEVSLEEYQTIEDAYMEFDGNKDEFCAMWSKLNAKRVKEAKAARKASEKRRKIYDKVADVVFTIRYNNGFNWRWNEPAIEVLPKAMQKVVEMTVGLRREICLGRAILKSVSDVTYEMDNYLKAL